MGLYNDVDEVISGSMDENGSFRRSVDKDRASDHALKSFVVYGAAGKQTFLTAVSPSGAIARPLGLVICNKELTPVSVELFDAAAQVIASIVVPAAASTIGETMVLTEDDLRGYRFESSIIGQVTGVFANGTDVSMVWWIDPVVTE